MTINQCPRTVSMQMWSLLKYLFLHRVTDYDFTFLTLVCNVAVLSIKHICKVAQKFNAKEDIVFYRIADWPSPLK